MPHPARMLLVVALLTTTAACADRDQPDPSIRTVSTATAPAPSAPGASPTRAAQKPPRWLGRRPLPLRADGLGEIEPTPRELRDRRFTLPDTIDELPGSGFASRIDRVPADVLKRSSWEAACPVTRDQLRWVRVTFWGFDDARHTGELLVNAEVADDLVAVFRRLYDARYPIEEMRITRADELDAHPTGDGNNTSAFTCRPATSGQGWSEHAKGLAIDVNPFLNPYTRGDVLIPELATAYLDRERRAPGMITADGPVVAAFGSIGWTWGGSWKRSRDLMHFSRNGL